jgi:spermidine synthase
MDLVFEELDFRETELGELILRRRSVLQKPGTIVYEVKLDDSFLMSSLNNESEIALAELGLAGLGSGPLDVVVGGLGLGSTARAALDHPGVASLLVVEHLEPVIDWHDAGLVPLGAGLRDDPRCRFVHDDFFARVLNGPGGMDPDDRERRFDAIVVDIDHSPNSFLSEDHRHFYGPEGLSKLARHLKPGGAFGLWSSEAPSAEFEAVLASVFVEVVSHPIAFHNLLLNLNEVNTVYVGRVGA